ncbi:hypothetical protein K2173_003163 [Erythroxylum novogranatense]|uniref:AT hook motif-containing protein n=1 Tax=Erythroxylum novogranatense TaxID=1862640 RepID=A0AAV8TA45_9ROSI|nr:hypothetical protein K2173_003163 [Erythroxylum novogranatense]
MNEANQENNLDASAIVPLKRKRGRPRKYPRPDSEGGNDHIPRNQNRNQGENAHVPPLVNGNNPRQLDPTTHANDTMVGQVVHGAIEAAFDAGYLLTVRVGNSETTLRGVVFKPGRYIPVSSDNDIAPGAQMIRRNEIPLPREDYSQVQGHNSRSRDRTNHMSQTADMASSKGMPQSAPLGEARGNRVPVVVQPFNLANGIAAPGEPSLLVGQASHQLASKGKSILETAHSSNGSTVTIVEQAAENQFPHFQSQDNQQMMPSGLQNEAYSFGNPTEAKHKGEAKHMRPPDMPFEKLLSEVVKKVQVPSQSKETISRSADKLSPKDSDYSMEDDGSDTDQPLSIEPLQALQPDLLNHPPVVSKPVEHYRTGKLTELLQLKSNVIEKHFYTQNLPLLVINQCKKQTINHAHEKKNSSES